MVKWKINTIRSECEISDNAVDFIILASTNAFVVLEEFICQLFDD